ncbi:MAG: GTP-binding protein [Alkalicoccus sp.]|nr:MAG: GTP-binding protein [Alkalicoccus sp.]
MIPVTIVTGCSGAGKTTLLHHLQSTGALDKAAVIVDDSSHIESSSLRVFKTEEKMMTISGDFLRYSVRADVIKAVNQILDEKTASHIFIETTGLADPAPVVQTFLMASGLQQHVEINAVITVVDTCHIQSQLQQFSEAAVQIAFADVILMNKSDAASFKEVERAESSVLSLNPFADMYQVSYCRTNPENLLHQYSFNLEHALTMRQERVTEPPHLNDLQSHTITISSPLDPVKVSAWIQWLVQKRGDNLLRCKGILHLEGQTEVIVLHGVHTFLSCHSIRRWHPGEEKKTEIVLIGKNLCVDELKRGLKACQAA